ncbi:MAG: TonB-dependent receptor [Burkholderiales bacterium]|nr:TonB-dependent receptor [Burkholderiales bacterium]MDE1929056.1 TonB-dependent receptor [Burkholderiales bacterium]MDE2160180.1 TonB-dependent receptor [Burkholderiales bacterium]MDE2502326.1 TonB-dependent receptor [Burkholderiales bacterium]
MRARALVGALVGAGFGFGPGPMLAAPAAADATPVQQVEIIGTTVLPGQGTPLDEVAGNVQTLRQALTSTRRALNLSEALNQSAGSISVNDTAGNPYQMDVLFRGFAASPALGTPQGLSVFVDGVRVNEAFGDTVNWDLIPAVAIDSVTVIPGSNPLFGLNTLGGAINVTTKSGATNPGTRVEGWAGSFGRRSFEFESGHQGPRHDFYVAGNVARESGWGEFNPSQVRQLFAKAGLHDARDKFELSATLADNRLQGNQTLPLSWLDTPRQSYSWPDFQTNRLAFVNASWTRRLDPALALDADLYYRALRTYAFNSNVNNNYDPALAIGPGNQPTGNAVNAIDEVRPGASLQLSSVAPLAGRANRWTLGASADLGRTAFTQSDQEAGSSRDTASTAPLVLATSLDASARSASVYATDTLGLDARTFLTVSARYNRARVLLRDQLGSALDGDHGYARLNPAIGLTFNPHPELTFHASYNEGMRVPTPVELTCADPNAPCSLPNAFASDPALAAVVSRTFEIGARGGARGGFEWTTALFRTDLSDDIQFISSGGGASSAGYFQNVGRTERQGFELGLATRAAGVRLSAHYSYIDARFRTGLIENSPSNSSAQPLSCPSCSDILVRPGDRMPGIARQLLKLRAEFEVAADATLGVNLQAAAPQTARGDENNRDVNGPVPGYATVDLDAHWSPAPRWELSARVANLLDRRYYTFGTLGQNVFTGPGRTFDASGASWRHEQYRSVGAPRGIWLGVGYRFSDG